MTRIKIILSVLLVMVAVTPVCAEWTQMQTQANQIATIARAMGLPETHSIITESSKIWWEEQTRVNNEAMEKAEFEASLQGFLNDHYAEAVAIAGVMYAEASMKDSTNLSMTPMISRSKQ